MKLPAEFLHSSRIRGETVSPIWNRQHRGTAVGLIYVSIVIIISNY